MKLLFQLLFYTSVKLSFSTPKNNIDSGCLEHGAEKNILILGEVNGWMEKNT
jgi:hypothetical protein